MPSSSPPAGFDPTAPLWAGQIPMSQDDAGGIWTAHIDGSDRYEWTSADNANVRSRLLDGVIWEQFDHGRGRFVLHIGRIGSPARVLTSRAWGFGSDTTADAFYTSLATKNGDDGLWRFPLDGSPSERVIPTLPQAFERGLTPMSVAVSDDGTQLARTFASGDLDEGGSHWVVQILNRGRLSMASFRSVYDFTADGELVVNTRNGYGIYDFSTGQVRPDPRDWLEFPVASPDGRYRVDQTSNVVTIKDQLTGAGRAVTIPALDWRDRWLTTDALVLEEQTPDNAYPTGVGRHLVMDLATGWYRLFDPIAPPVE